MTRVAVISDMHGNDLAFEKVEVDLQGQRIDQIVCLGDAIQGGSQPAQVVQRLRRMNCPVVMGNADAWLLSGEETADEGIPPERLKKMGEIRLWSLSQLSEDDMDFISKFQPTVTIRLEEGLDLLCFHGSPTSFDDTDSAGHTRGRISKVSVSLCRSGADRRAYPCPADPAAWRSFLFQPGKCRICIQSLSTGWAIPCRSLGRICDPDG